MFTDKVNVVWEQNFEDFQFSEDFQQNNFL